MSSRVLLVFSIVASTAGMLPDVTGAQSQSRKPAVFVRQIRIDSILLAFGVDSARVRAAVLGALRDAGRLAPETTKDVLSFDVDVAAPRSPGGIFDPRGFIHLEVGRNLVESGKSTKPQWQRTFDRPASRTWREFSRGTLAEVLMAVNTYLLAGNGGA